MACGWKTNVHQPLGKTRVAYLRHVWLTVVVSVLEQQIAQLENQIVGITLVAEAKTEVASSLETEISDLSELFEEGYVDKQRLRELDRSLAQILGEIAEFEAKHASALVAIEETRLKILQYEKRFISQVVDRITVLQEELHDSQQRMVALSDKVLGQPLQHQSPERW